MTGEQAESRWAYYRRTFTNKVLILGALFGILNTPTGEPGLATMLGSVVGGILGIALIYRIYLMIRRYFSSAPEAPDAAESA